MIDILVPTYGRPHVLQRVVDNVREATSVPYELVFAVEASDWRSRGAGRKTGARVVTNRYEPSYSNSFQTAFELTRNPFFIAGNDDFDFQPGWDTEALKLMGDGVLVVGIHDGAPNCEYRTIALVDRSYVELGAVLDMPGRVFYPYKHNYVDTEFHATAVKHGVFKECPTARILHRHPDWGYVADDATYRKSKASMSEDGHTYNLRAHLWE